MASVVDDKRRQTEMARAAGVRTVQIFCGIIMENIISGPHTGVEFLPSRRRIMALTSDSGGEHPVSFTSSWDVGKAIAAVSTMPVAVTRGDLDQVHISGDTSSWSKLAKLMGAQHHPMSSSSFESQVLNHTSPIESFIRIAAAEGQLHFPSPQSSRSRRGIPTNQNYLVDTYTLGAQPWVKLAQVVRHFDKHDSNASQQPGTSSPDESSKATSKKRKRGDSDSASVESNPLQSHDEDPKSREELGNAIGGKIIPAPSPKAKSSTSKPKSSTLRRSTRLRATTQRESTAVLEKRITRSMTKRGLDKNTSNKNKPKNKKKAAAATRRTSKRRRVG
ncbi:hypothetical protein TWF281_011801 [Arthrobotrys megalospora]